jgi:DNA polymerase-1
VGISPAENELKLDRPFIGWSGQVLRQTLAKLGITKYYLTNTSLCYYPSTEELEEGVTQSSIIKQVTVCCSKRLSAELKSVGAKLVVGLGNIALEALIGQDVKVRNLNGRILPGPEFPILAVIHPAGLKRRPDEFYDFLGGLASAKRFFAGTYLETPVPNTVIINTEEELLQVCKRIKEVGIVAVDTETTKTGFYPYGRDPDRIRCVIVAMNDHEVYIIPGVSSPYYEPTPDFHQHPALIEALEGAKLITHNGPFDIGFFKQAGYKNIKMWFDTFLAHYVLDERGYSHGLKPLSAVLLGAPDWEDELKQYLPHKNSSYDLIPTEKLFTYAGYDGVMTYKLSEGNEGKGGFREAVSRQPIFQNLLMPAANMFSELRHTGFPIDINTLLELDELLAKDYEEDLQELTELIGSEINPLSPTEVKSLLYEKLGFPIVERYGPSTGKLVLRQLGGRICEKILQCRETKKLGATYVVGMANFIDKDFRIHPLTNLHGAVTGRISTEDPSVMNITARGGIKRLYIPEPGHLIVEMDAKAMELVCGSIIFHDEHLQQLLIKSRTDKNFDPHGLVARRASELTGTEIIRQKAKSGVFGKMYGRGIESFIYGYGLTREQALLLMQAIDELFPSLKQYNIDTKKEIHEKGYLTSFFGRKRRFGLIMPENRGECYRQGTNFKIQSMASDVNLYTMLHIYENRERLHCVPMFPVHDSIIMDVESKEWVGPIQNEIETYATSLVKEVSDMTYKYEVKGGLNWGETTAWCEKCLEFTEVYTYMKDRKEKKGYKCPKCGSTEF